MATTETNTARSETTEQTIWRIAVCEYEREAAAYQPFAEEYEAACRGYDMKNAAPEAEARYDAAEKAWEAALDKLSAARERVFLAPAPDANGLLYKLDILLPYLRLNQIEDLERIEALDADIRRLLGRAA